MKSLVPSITMSSFWGVGLFSEPAFTSSVFASSAVAAVAVSVAGAAGSLSLRTLRGRPLRFCVVRFRFVSLLFRVPLFLPGLLGVVFRCCWQRHRFSLCYFRPGMSFPGFLSCFPDSLSWCLPVERAISEFRLCVPPFACRRLLFWWRLQWLVHQVFCKQVLLFKGVWFFYAQLLCDSLQFRQTFFVQLNDVIHIDMCKLKIISLG